MKYIIILLSLVTLASCSFTKEPEPTPSPAPTPAITSPSLPRPPNEMTVQSTGSVVSPVATGTTTPSLLATGTTKVTPSKVDPKDEKEIQETMKDIDSLFSDIEKGSK